MEKIWFLLIDGKEEGPYSIADLRRHIRLTPDTPVRRKGTARWILLRFIPELQSLFEDEPESKPPSDKKKDKNKSQLEDGGVVLALRQDPPSFWFWILIAAIVLFYVLYQLSHS